MQIKTKRLVLIPIEKKYFDTLCTLIKQDNKEFSRWTSIPYPFNKKKTLDFYKKALKKKNECIYVITERKTKQIFGQLHAIRNERVHSATIGYWIGKEFRKKGYMTEAAKAVIAFCFEKWKVMRIEITAEERNKASQKVIEKCRLKFEGIRRMGTYSGLKEYGNLKVYSIIRPEWKKKHPTP